MLEKIFWVIIDQSPAPGPRACGRRRTTYAFDKSARSGRASFIGHIYKRVWEDGGCGAGGSSFCLAARIISRILKRIVLSCSCNPGEIKGYIVACTSVMIRVLTGVLIMNNYIPEIVVPFHLDVSQRLKMSRVCVSDICMRSDCLCNCRIILLARSGVACNLSPFHQGVMAA